jgi:hypothetical protein
MRATPIAPALRFVVGLGSLMLSVMLAVGCHDVTGFESSEALCREDTRDEDGDGKANCLDPDCWAFEICRQDRLASDAGTHAPVAGQGGSLAMDQDDAGRVDEDAGAPSKPRDGGPPAGCAGANASCPDAQTCRGGACMPEVDRGTTFHIRVASAVVPDRASNNICFDGLLSDVLVPCSLGPAVDCGNCKPDPYVVSALNGEVKGTTGNDANTVTPSWDDPAFDVVLFAGDKLTFTVKDKADPGFSDATIFTCEVEAAVLIKQGGGTHECRPQKDATVEPPKGTVYGLTLEYGR